MTLKQFYRKRRIIGYICILLYLFLSVAYEYVPAQATEIQGDIGNIEYLSAFGVIEKWQNDDEWYNDNLLRGEMAQLACGMLNMTGVANGMETEQIFDDVEKNSLYVSYVNYLSRAEIISGNGESFYPKNTITYMEMAKIIAGVLGYKVEAEARGGYPHGYLEVIQKLRLFSGVSDFNSIVTRSQAYAIIAETMEVNIMSYIGRSEESGNYAVIEGENLLSAYHNINIHQGIVTGNQYTSLYAKDGMGEGRIRIDDKIYKTSVDNSNMFLGYSVKGYVDKENNIVFIKEEEENNHISVIGDNISPETNKTEFVYYKDENAEKTNRVRLDSNASVIYNERYCGKLYTEVITREDMMPKSGNVYLLDNNDDNTYDVIFISSYEIYVADSVSQINKKIRTKYTEKEIDCDVDDLVLKDVNGSTVEISQIVEWNILAVAYTKDQKLLQIIVLNNTVDGEISQINEEFVVIGDTKYKISEYFPEETDLILGKRGRFCFDIENKLAAVDYSTGSDVYGYLISASLDGTFESTLHIKLFSESGEVKTFECDKKITYNKNSDNIKDTPEKMYERLLNGGTVKNQLIKYSINDEKKIVSIELASQTPSYDCFSLGFEQSDAFYIVGKINYKYFMPDSVKIFSIPEDKTAEDDYLMITKKGITGDKEYNIQLYDIDKNNFVGAAILNVGNSEAVNAGDYSLTVKEAMETVNKDGENVKVICGYTKGEYVELEVVDDTVETISGGVWGYDGTKISDLVCGDVIQVSKNAYGKISKFRVLFRPDSTEKYILKNGIINTNSSQELITHTLLAVNYAQVSRRTAKAVIHDKDNEKVLNTIGLAVNPVVYIYDAKAGDKLVVGTMDDIEAGDWLLVLYNWSTAREYIVYRY